MPQGSRPDRVGDQIRAEISALLVREVHDPGIGFVTITRVQVTADLQLARVFYTALGEQAARRSSAKALQRAAPFLRHQIGQRLRLRRVPVLEFAYDESIEQQLRVEQLLHEIHTSDGASNASPDDDDDDRTRD
ncbi:MAG: 30S ribosome-binding factor RbfA [Acidobacteria bacterium]|nr:30S ribosome-binding factor RbfA [Acidobacteriota bacterium]